MSAKSHLRHDYILALLNEPSFSLHDSLQKLDVLNAAPVGLDTVSKVLDNALVNLTAQLEVIHEDVLHGDCFQNL